VYNMGVVNRDGPSGRQAWASDGRLTHSLARRCAEVLQQCNCLFYLHAQSPKSTPPRQTFPVVCVGARLVMQWLYASGMGVGDFA
jgi:hypothetical protein